MPWCLSKWNTRKQTNKRQKKTSPLMENAYYLLHSWNCSKRWKKAITISVQMTLYQTFYTTNWSTEEMFCPCSQNSLVSLLVSKSMFITRFAFSNNPWCLSLTHEVVNINGLVFSISVLYCVFHCSQKVYCIKWNGTVSKRVCLALAITTL